MRKTQHLGRHIACWLALAASLGLLLGCQDKAVTDGPAGMASALSFYKAIPRTREYWPSQGWKTKQPSEVGIDPAALKVAVEYAFKRTGNDKDRKGIRTDGLVIIKHGYLAFERYARGFGPKKPHLVWSVSKSFVNALYGIAKRQGKFKLDESAARYYPPLRKSKHHKAITIRQLLNMTPGLHWYEGYEAGILKSSVLAMLYGRGRDDMAAFTASFPMKYTPGTHFYYSSGTTNLAVGVLRSILKGQKLEAYMWRELFDAIGMKQVTWQRDNAGHVVGSSYLYAPPRQLAKFGYLYLNDGVWGDKRILPKGWVKFTATTPKADPKGRYGAHWWLNTGRPAKGVARRFPEAPSDLFMAGGHWGQQIIVIPSLDMVVVVTADNRDKTFSRRTFLKLLMAAVKGRKLQANAPAPAKRPDATPANDRDKAPKARPTNATQPGDR